MKQLLHVKIPHVDRFDYRLNFHYHLMCTQCGAVCDVPLSYHTELDQEVAAKTGYVVERHETVFEGLCPGCQHRAEHR